MNMSVEMCVGCQRLYPSAFTRRRMLVSSRWDSEGVRSVILGPLCNGCYEEYPHMETKHQQNGVVR